MRACGSLGSAVFFSVISTSLVEAILKSRWKCSENERS
jgi:hypothetical protein